MPIETDVAGSRKLPGAVSCAGDPGVGVTIAPPAPSSSALLFGRIKVSLPARRAK
jgi:hypothetical protein